jgi:hypothetical protein
VDALQIRGVNEKRNSKKPAEANQGRLYVELKGLYIPSLNAA